jgi:hypothetical protein
VRASTSPPGPTIFDWPRKRRPPSLPVWLALTTTTWFSAARAQSYRSKRRDWRSWTSRAARLVTLAGQAQGIAMISAPCIARVRAASGKLLS